MSADSPTLRARTHQTGLWIFMATAAMLFTAFASSYLVRRGGSDWSRSRLPDTLWTSTGLLLLGSGTMEMARRTGSRRWLLGTIALGVAFALSQALAWDVMARQGAFEPANPHRAFFYVITGAHAAHLGGGLIALWIVFARPTELSLRLGAVYWHFLAGVWVAMFALMRLL